MALPVPVILSDREWTLAHGRQRAVVNARGGALRSYEVAGRQVVDGWSDRELPPAFNGAVLAPWPNRIRDGRWSLAGVEQLLAITEPARGTALHGLVAWTDWQLSGHSPSAITLGCRVAAQPGYPFELQLEVTWSLTDDGLRCELAARNLSDDDAPFGIATHPFFGFDGSRVDDFELTLPATRWTETDDRLLPVEVHEVAGTDYDFRAGRGLAGVRLDTAFTGLQPQPDGTSEVLVRSGGAEVTVWADAGFGWWQVYTSDMFDAGDDRYRRSVAVEAMTCGPDAFNSGSDVLLLPPGGRWTGSWGVRTG